MKREQIKPAVGDNYIKEFFFVMKLCPTLLRMKEKIATAKEV